MNAVLYGYIVNGKGYIGLERRKPYALLLDIDWPNLSFHSGLLAYGYVLPYLKQLAKEGTSDDVSQTKRSISCT